MHDSVLAIAALLLCACSSASGAPAPPTQCQAGNFTGTYFAHYVTRTSGCATIPDGITLVDPSAMGSAQSCRTLSTVFSDGDCSVEIRYTCGQNGVYVNITAYLVQETQDGSSLQGELTFTIPNQVTCTYAVTYTRR
jgi:hypothetical protein